MGERTPKGIITFTTPKNREAEAVTSNKDLQDQEDSFVTKLRNIRILLADIQRSAPGYISQAIQKVLDLLHQTDPNNVSRIESRNNVPHSSTSVNKGSPLTVAPPSDTSSQKSTSSIAASSSKSQHAPQPRKACPIKSAAAPTPTPPLEINQTRVTSPSVELLLKDPQNTPHFRCMTKKVCMPPDNRQKTSFSQNILGQRESRFLHPGDPGSSEVGKHDQGGLPPCVSAATSEFNSWSAMDASDPAPGTIEQMEILIRTYQMPQIILTNIYGWNFDILGLQKITNSRALVCLGMKIMPEFEVHKVLGINIETLQNWLILMEANYNNYLPYHTNVHAADVLQATAYFLKTDRLKKFLEPLDQCIALIAAAVHDVDHPGLTNSHLTSVGHPLAMLYNDRSILECHHAALTFKLTFIHDMVNIFQHLDPEVYKRVRAGIIDMILATEMLHHSEQINQFISALKATPGGPAASHRKQCSARQDPDSGEDPFRTKENIILVRRMLIKCSDISNPARPLSLAIEWALRICEEFYRQTELETSNNIPLTLPSFAKQKCGIPCAQTGFNDFLTFKLFTAWHEFLDVEEVIENLRQNHKHWGLMEEKGISTPEEIKNYLEDNKATTGLKL